MKTNEILKGEFTLKFTDTKTGAVREVTEHNEAVYFRSMLHAYDLLKWGAASTNVHAGITVTKTEESALANYTVSGSITEESSVVSTYYAPFVNMANIDWYTEKTFRFLSTGSPVPINTVVLRKGNDVLAYASLISTFTQGAAEVLDITYKLIVGTSNIANLGLRTYIASNVRVGLDSENTSYTYGASSGIQDMYYNPNRKVGYVPNPTGKLGTSTAKAKINYQFVSESFFLDKPDYVGCNFKSNTPYLYVSNPVIGIPYAVPLGASSIIGGNCTDKQPMYPLSPLFNKSKDTVLTFEDVDHLATGKGYPTISSTSSTYLSGDQKTDQHIFTITKSGNTGVSRFDVKVLPVGFGLSPKSNTPTSGGLMHGYAVETENGGSSTESLNLATLDRTIGFYSVDGFGMDYTDSKILTVLADHTDAAITIIDLDDQEYLTRIDKLTAVALPSGVFPDIGGYDHHLHTTLSNGSIIIARTDGICVVADPEGTPSVSFINNATLGLTNSIKALNASGMVINILTDTEIARSTDGGGTWSIKSGAFSTYFVIYANGFSPNHIAMYSTVSHTKMYWFDWSTEVITNSAITSSALHRIQVKMCGHIDPNTGLGVSGHPNGASTGPSVITLFNPMYHICENVQGYSTNTGNQKGGVKLFRDRLGNSQAVLSQGNTNSNSSRFYFTIRTPDGFFRFISRNVNVNTHKGFNASRFHTNYFVSSLANDMSTESHTLQLTEVLGRYWSVFFDEDVLWNDHKNWNSDDDILNKPYATLDNEKIFIDGLLMRSSTYRWDSVASDWALNFNKDCPATADGSSSLGAKRKGFNTDSNKFNGYSSLDATDAVSSASYANGMTLLFKDDNEVKNVDVEDPMVAFFEITDSTTDASLSLMRTNGSNMDLVERLGGTQIVHTIVTTPGVGVRRYAVTINSTGSDVKVYQDGAQIGSTVTLTNSFPLGATTLETNFGSKNRGFQLFTKHLGCCYRGNLTNILVFNNVLSGTDIITDGANPDSLVTSTDLVVRYLLTVEDYLEGKPTAAGAITTPYGVDIAFPDGDLSADSYVKSDFYMTIKNEYGYMKTNVESFDLALLSDVRGVDVDVATSPIDGTATIPATNGSITEKAIFASGDDRLALISSMYVNSTATPRQLHQTSVDDITLEFTLAQHHDDFGVRIRDSLTAHNATATVTDSLTVILKSNQTQIELIDDTGTVTTVAQVFDVKDKFKLEYTKSTNSGTLSIWSGGAWVQVGGAITLQSTAVPTTTAIQLVDRSGANINSISQVQVTYTAAKRFMRLGNKATNTGGYNQYVVRGYTLAEMPKSICVELDGIAAPVTYINNGSGVAGYAQGSLTQPVVGSVNYYSVTNSLEFNDSDSGKVVTVSNAAVRQN